MNHEDLKAENAHLLRKRRELEKRLQTEPLEAKLNRLMKGNLTDDEARLRDNRMQLKANPQKVDALLARTWSTDGVKRFEDEFGSEPDDWTVTWLDGKPFYKLNPYKWGPK